MTKIIDEDVIRNKPVSDAYRDGWERCFGDAPHAEPADKCTDTIECKITTWANVQPVVCATFPVPEYVCPTCCDTGCVVDPDVDPSTVTNEGDLLKDCPACVTGPEAREP